MHSPLKTWRPLPPCPDRDPSMTGDEHLNGNILPREIGPKYVIKVKMLQILFNYYMYMYFLKFPNQKDYILIIKKKKKINLNNVISAP